MFPDVWGPPPSFAVSEISKNERKIKHVQQNAGNHTSPLKSRLTLTDDDDENSSHKDACESLQLFTVANCPAASSELLVSQKSLICAKLAYARVELQNQGGILK